MPWSVARLILAPQFLARPHARNLPSSLKARNCRRASRRKAEERYQSQASHATWLPNIPSTCQHRGLVIPRPQIRSGEALNSVRCPHFTVRPFRLPTMVGKLRGAKGGLTQCRHDPIVGLRDVNQPCKITSTVEHWVPSFLTLPKIKRRKESSRFAAHNTWRYVT
jgi:hypothetical protein